MNSLTHCLSRKYMGDEMTTIAAAQRSRSLLCISVHVWACVCERTCMCVNVCINFSLPSVAMTLAGK